MRSTLTLALILVAAPAALGQHYTEWSAPVSLGPGINTSATDGCPNISKDGLALFFASTRAGGTGASDIYVVTRSSKSAPWGAPQNLGPNVNSSGNEVCPALALDERRLFFVSNRSGGCGGQDLYVARRASKNDPLGWEPAANLGCTVNTTAEEFGPVYYEDQATGEETLLVSSGRPAGKGGVDLYRTAAAADGSFGAAVLIEELSTAFDDARPAILRDGLAIVFDSNRPGGLGGTDLWTASRDDPADPWSEPVWMETVNSSASEIRPALSFSGTELYFTSSRAGGSGGSDIWISTRKKVTRSLHTEDAINTRDTGR